jgi:hypothetical protein
MSSRNPSAPQDTPRTAPVEQPMTEREIHQVAMMPPHEYKGIMQARVAQEAEKIQTQDTIPGGLFYVDGNWVNANGERVKAPSGVEEPKPAEPVVEKPKKPAEVEDEQPQMATLQPGEPGYVAPPSE